MIKITVKIVQIGKGKLVFFLRPDQDEFLRCFDIADATIKKLC